MIKRNYNNPGPNPKPKNPQKKKCKMSCPFKFKSRAVTNDADGRPDMTSYEYDACKLVNTGVWGQSECDMKRNGGNKCVGEKICPIIKK